MEEIAGDDLTAVRDACRGEDRGAPAATAGSSNSRDAVPYHRPLLADAILAHHSRAYCRRLTGQFQKSMYACGSVLAVQNSVILPARTWITFATAVFIDLEPREAESVPSATTCSSLASMS